MALPKLLVLGALLVGPPSARADDLKVSVQRYLMSLQLGDWMKEIKILYPPLREWPSYMEPKGGVLRIHIERPYARYFPEDVETLRLGMRHGRLVHVQAVFDEAQTKRQPLDALVQELSLLYGEPRRESRGSRAYFWDDGGTVLRALYAEVPSKDGKAVELRTSMEIMEPSVYRPSY